MAAHTIKQITSPSEELVSELGSIGKEAFVNDPIHPPMCGGDTSLLQAFWESYIRAGVLEGELYAAYVDEKPAGFALWYAPGTGFMETEKQRSESGYDKLMTNLGAEGQAWWEKEFFTKEHAQATKCYGEKGNHATHHLILLAVLPNHQRTGLGRALINHGSNIAKGKGTFVTLTTFRDKNIGIYKKIGLTQDDQVPINCRFGDFICTAMSLK